LPAPTKTILKSSQLSDNMPTIKGLLNRIKWDKSLNPKDFIITYDDKGIKKEIAYSSIKSIEGRFMKIKNLEIPIYRILEIKERGKIIFKR